jgi:2',3'-cyclic-nucleotide 2'-phosphodiesterase (5'-nucleotidase family)
VVLRAVNLEKYHVALKQFGLILTFILGASCSHKYHVDKIEGKQIAITENYSGKADIESYIKPYRENIDKDMNVVLAYSPQTLDKSGEWQTTIGNLMADVALERGNQIFSIREKKDIDFCLLNYGGIRSILPKGNVTTRNAFEIMPFENSLIVAALKGEQVTELLNYIISEKKAHPISGMTFTIGKDGTAKDIMIKGKAFDAGKTYYVVTSDYLVNGGDNMNFFKKATATYDLDYKIRNVLIDYFKDVDTIPVITDIRIKKE